MTPQLPVERVFARWMFRMSVSVDALIHLANGSFLGTELLGQLQRWCRATEARLENARIELERRP